MEKKEDKARIEITAPNMGIALFKIIGTSPLMISSFTEKAINKMRAAQEAGSRAKSKKAREARDFEKDYRDAMHVSTDGWPGIAAGAFRTGMVDACRLVGYPMTRAKLAIFIEADGLDSVVKTPLVRIIGTPEMVIRAERNDDGSMDLRSRPSWTTWMINPLRVRFDQDMFSISAITNLLLRVGLQVGVGEGRPNSKNSTGIGYGLFSVDPEVDVEIRQQYK